MFQILNQIKQQVHRAVLSSRPMLIHDGVNGHGGVNARQIMAGLIAPKGLHDGNSAVLPIIGKSSPPDDSEDLAGLKVVHAASPGLFMVYGGRAKAQPIKSAAGDIAGNKTG
jgi:hypothetical protein